uniref:Uncharacterized protein n=1 Tax=Glycine max TaxID=3847 RepID=C6TCF9_SOYBN|nr:unknown [Glycine max]
MLIIVEMVQNLTILYMFWGKTTKVKLLKWLNISHD